VGTWVGHEGSVLAVVEMPGNRLASASYDQKIIVWDLQNTQKKHALLTGHTKPIMCLIVMIDGRLASGSADASIRVWDVPTSKCVHTYSGHSKSVNCLTQLLDGRLVSGSEDRSIKVWNLPQPKSLFSSFTSVLNSDCAATLSGHTDFVSDICRVGSTTSYVLASASGDKTIKLWDLSAAPPKCIATLSAHVQPVLALCPLPDGRLASASQDKSLLLWTFAASSSEAPPSSPSSILTLPANASSLVPLKDGRLLCGLDDGSILVSDPSSFQKY